MWRLRAIIETEVEVIPGEIEFEGGMLSVFEVNESNTEGGANIPPNVRYCDIFGENIEGDILEAFASLYDRTNIYLDRISAVSYGRAYLRDILSVTPSSVSPGEEFEIAIPQFMFDRKTNPIKLENLLLDKATNDIHLRLERLMRLV